MNLGIPLHDIGKPAPSVATPPKYSTFNLGEPSYATENDTAKQADRRDAIVVMLEKDVKCSIGEPRHDAGHGVGKPTPSVATPFFAMPYRTPYLAQMKLTMPSGTTLENAKGRDDKRRYI
jgi:hypothetical protein